MTSVKLFSSHDGFARYCNAQSPINFGCLCHFSRCSIYLLNRLPAWQAIGKFACDDISEHACRHDASNAGCMPVLIPGTLVCGKYPVKPDILCLSMHVPTNPRFCWRNAALAPQKIEYATIAAIVITDPNIIRALSHFRCPELTAGLPQCERSVRAMLYAINYPVIFAQRLSPPGSTGRQIAEDSLDSPLRSHHYRRGVNRLIVRMRQGVDRLCQRHNV